MGDVGWEGCEGWEDVRVGWGGCVIGEEVQEWAEAQFERGGEHKGERISWLLSCVHPYCCRNGWNLDGGRGA